MITPRPNRKLAGNRFSDQIMTTGGVLMIINQNQKWILKNVESILVQTHWWSYFDNLEAQTISAQDNHHVSHPSSWSFCRGTGTWPVSSQWEDWIWRRSVSARLLERSGGRRASNNGLEESQALPRWQSCKENLYVLLPWQQLWIGGKGRREGGKDGERWWGEGKERKKNGRDWVTGWGERKERGGLLVVRGAEIGVGALLFPPSLPCLRWMALDCVGEFTVRCCLISNKVTQQIL